MWRKHVAESSVDMCVGSKHTVFAAELLEVQGMSKSDKWVSFRNDYEKNSEKVQKEHLISPNSSFQKLDVSFKLDVSASPVAYVERDLQQKYIPP